MNWDPRLGPVRELMRLALEAPDPAAEQLYGWLRYQLGWALPDGRPAELPTGKGLRPLLCLVACEAVGGNPAMATPAAAGIELTHEFSLVHDDIEDGDRLRRGRDALWSVIGLAQGINAGDALFILARRTVTGSRVPDDVMREMTARYDQACLRLAEGQYLDLAFEGREIVPPTDYLGMIARKTGALMSCAAALGSLAGGGTIGVADALADFGEALGMAFQIQDDILGLWGDPNRTGKPAGADLLRRKKTFPVLLALADADLAALLAELFGSADPTTRYAARVAEAIADRGLRDAAARTARDQAERALERLSGLRLAPGPAAELASLVDRAVARDR